MPACCAIVGSPRKSRSARLPLAGVRGEGCAKAVLRHIIRLMQEYRIGPNRNYVDGDLIYTVLDGFTDAKTAAGYIALVAQVQKEQGQVFTIISNAKNQTMDPGARRLFYEFARRNVITALATIGGGPVYRTMLTLMIRALRIANTNICPFGFFATEREARVWVQEQQRIYAAALMRL